MTTERNQVTEGHNAVIEGRNNMTYEYDAVKV